MNRAFWNQAERRWEYGEPPARAGAGGAEPPQSDEEKDVQQLVRDALTEAAWHLDGNTGPTPLIEVRRSEARDLIRRALKVVAVP